RDLEALIAAYERPHGLLDGTQLDLGEADTLRLSEEVDDRETADGSPSGPRDPSGAATGEDPRIGTEVGGYRLISRLGEGGMATVYRAMRAGEDFDHEAAIKLVRRGMDSPALLDRLRTEQRILASLDHPNIARFYDGGVTPEGQPYIVMERVEGEPLDAYADRHRLDIERRLELFTTVCRAVEHAHAKLVVHRDLKPSNILVRGDGAVKILDFGIAKLLWAEEAGAAEPSTLTSLYGAPLTPEYASPEQLAGEVVTTATDVYALGVLLYQLLVGSRPFDLAEPAAGALFAHRRSLAAALEGEPEKPSARLETTQDAERAARRSSSPRALRRRLVGDLDTLVLCAIRRDIERRYPSVSALREDIERHLANLPLRARPDSMTYVTGRFVARHRLGVAAALAVALALVAALGVALHGQATARREAATAQRISDFMIDVFRASDPGLGQSGTIEARHLLARAAERLPEDLEGDPEVRARLAQVMAEAAHNLGAYEEAQSLIAQSVEIFAEARGETDAATLAARNLEALVLSSRGRLEQAEKRFRAVLEGAAGRYPGSALEATVTNDLGMLLVEEDRLEEAETLYRRSLAIHSERGTGESQEAIRTRSNLAIARRMAGDLETAEAMLREVLELQRQTLTEPHVDIATALNNLAVAVSRRGNLEEAEILYREALEQRRGVLGGAHPDVAQSYNNIGTVRYRANDLPAALENMSRAVEIWRQAFEGDHPQLAAGLTNLGSVSRRLGRLELAEDYYTQALEMREGLHGPGHVQIAESLRRLGETIAALGRAGEAIALLERSLALHERASGLASSRSAEAAISLLAAYRQDGGHDAEATALADRLRSAGLEDPSLLERLE
ncbi:MAG: serine/threonine-protein kinase, partial [Acidobacteriota bacterium]